MKNLTYKSLLACLVVSFATACIYIPPVWDVGDEIYAVDQIQVGVTTRAEVLELLGEPDSENRYEGKIGYKGASSSGAIGVPYYGGGLIDPQNWWITITFNENDVVQELTCIGSEWCTEKRERNLTKKVETGDLSAIKELIAFYRLQKEPTKAMSWVAELERRARGGDVDAMHEYASEVEFSERWRWYCAAAQRGLAKARWQMGLMYRAGYLGLEQDLVLAYVWYTLALEDGYDIAEGYRNRLSKEMTPAQIAEADRLVAEWEPNPAECEIVSPGSDAP